MSWFTEVKCGPNIGIVVKFIAGALWGAGTLYAGQRLHKHIQKEKKREQRRLMKLIDEAQKSYKMDRREGEGFNAYFERVMKGKL